jgi:hypothetical protein
VEEKEENKKPGVSRRSLRGLRNAAMISSVLWLISIGITVLIFKHCP